LSLRVLSLVSFILFCANFCADESFAQKTNLFTDENAEYDTGVKLFEDQKYVSAQKCFENVIALRKDPNSLIGISAEYYSAVCATELFNRDAEILLKQFIARHPESPYVKKARFNLGKYSYRKKKYREAIDYFWSIDLYDLSSEEQAELYFKRGYCYFQLSQLSEQSGKEPEKEKLDPLIIHNDNAPRKYVASSIENAKADFYQIKDKDTKYTHPANYYYSHIAYKQKNYETALQGFLNLAQDENFGPIVPYYITQIYYIQGKYPEAVKYATPLLTDSTNIKRLPEIIRIIGESDYRTGKFAEAIPYLKKFEKAVVKLNRQDQYEMAYAYYKAGDCDNAISYFQEVTDEKDTLTQNAYYHLADCYIKKNNRQGARTAFGFAARMEYDPQIRENALYCYAKLCYELAYNPFNEAIRAFQQYISLYPASPRIDECRSYLVNVYMTTHNYKEALRSIESMSILKEDMKPVYQKVAYYRAVDFFNNAQMDSAIYFFDKSLTHPLDKSMSALAWYWKGEACYRKKEYSQAIENYSTFMSKPGAFGMQQYNNANYSNGYSYFQLKEYESANLSFRKFVESKYNAKDKTTARRIADAYIRAGDCYFISQNYSSAVEYYSEAIREKLLDVDYSLYQRAMANGLLKKTDAKIADLLMATNDYPKSVYSPTLKFELGKTYFQIDEYDKAIPYFQKVLDEYPNCSYTNRCLSQIGLIYYNKKEDEKALSQFDKLIRKDRKSEEAEAVLPIVRKIYVARNDIPGLEKYFKEISASIPESSLDSSSFSIVKNAFLEGNCDLASTASGNYITRFPEGMFIQDVYFYKAECDYKSGNQDLALKEYSYLLEKNKYTEQSLVAASGIDFKKGNFAEASGYYSKLEELAEYPQHILDARVGQMRCSFQLRNYDAAITASNKVISTDKANPELLTEAHFVIARSAFELKNYDLSFTEFQTTANLAKGEVRVEAEYTIALLYYLKGAYKDSKTTLFEMIKTESAYPLWMTKGLILLSDNYLALKDNFQAKHTLKSVIESSDFKDQVKLAQDKLNVILESEKTPPPVPESGDNKVEFKQNSEKENSKLFNENQLPGDSLKKQSDK